MVYVLSVSGKPLMPTQNHAKVRILLKQRKAHVAQREPFTIQLDYACSEQVLAVTLGVDAGSKHIGLCSSSEKKALYAADVELRNDIVELLSTRRESRRSRRSRKTRYRRCKFKFRTRRSYSEVPIRTEHLQEDASRNEKTYYTESHWKKETVFNLSKRKKGWLAPSVLHKVNTHLEIIQDAVKLIPVSKIRIETASFDTQKLKAEEAGLELPQGTDYQNGDQSGFWNVREYVLFRDKHKCQNPNCKHKKDKDLPLNVHHIQSRKTGGDAPSNLITLCEFCHHDLHAGKWELKIKRGKRYNDAAFMGIMRWNVYDRLKEMYPDITVEMTFGYITKTERIAHGLPKDHYIDAYVIAGNFEAELPKELFYQKKIRRHNRQIHKTVPAKGGIRKNNQAAFEVHGFRLFDKVLYRGNECFVTGRRTRGYFRLKKLDGTIVHTDANYKEIRLLQHSGRFITERRTAG